MVIVHFVDDLRTQQFGLDAVLKLHPERSQHRLTGVFHFRLGLGMKLEHPEVTFHHHQPRADVGRLECGIGDLVDENARGNFNENRGHPDHRQIAAGVSPQVGGELRLQTIQINIGAELNHKALLGRVASSRAASHH